MRRDVLMVRGALRRIAVGAVALAVVASVSPTLAQATESQSASAAGDRACATGGVNLAGSLTDGGGLRGRQALAALGSTSTVSRAAALNGLSSTRFTEIMRTDSTSRLDRCGRLLYVEPTAAAAPAEPPTQSALSVAGDAFTLNSRPGAQKTIFLDFDGHTLATSAWSSYFNVSVGRVLPAYDSDGNAASFSASELTAIKDIWLAVSEDYAAFNVNVTTQDPGADALNRTGYFDPTYGAHAVITSDSEMGAECGCGGIAYIGTMYDYGADQAYYQPALVFSSQLGNGYSKYVAEAATHEVGHNYGLYHDGNATSAYYKGQGAWAPIMGVGYYKPLVQWSKGEYTGANNTEDDAAIIAQNSPLAPDDHGGASTSASALTFDAAASGVIGSPTDTDWFSFTSATGGRFAVSVQTQSYAPNLDSELTVYDSAGALLSTSNPTVPTSFSSVFSTTGMASSLSFPYLAPGTYFARVTGSGQGSPQGTGYSNYSSLGRYEITATQTAATPFTITTASLPAGESGTAYSQSLAASGGLGNAASWAVVSGSLPDGITLSSPGVLSGIPTTAGDFTVVVRATEAVTGLTDSRSLTLSVRGLTIDGGQVPGGEVGVPYSATLTATDGTGPVTWSLISGSLPGGVTLTSGGELAGTPNTAGEFAFTVRAADSGSGLASRALTISVDRGLPAITSAPAATTITYGQPLARSVLSGGVATVDGVFAWTAPSTVPGAGTASYAVTFSPTDSVNCRPVTLSVPVTVDRALPSVTSVPSAGGITYGQALARSVLSGGVATVDGVFAWTAPSMVPGAGTASYAVTFTPTDSVNYAPATATVPVTVDRATPTIRSMPASTAVYSTQTLASSALIGGVGSVPGSFTWATPRTIAPVGTSMQRVIFRPADSARYATATAQVRVTVLAGRPTSVLYTGAQVVTASARLALTAARTGPSGCAAPRFALDRNPLTGSSGTYALMPVNGSVATTRWREGAYRITVSYGGSGACGASTDTSTLAVSTTGTAAHGGGRYSLSGAGRVDMAFTVRRLSTGAYTGALTVVNQGAWRVTGSVGSYARTGGTAVVRGTGRLDRWDRTLNGGRGAWALASSSVSFRAIATAASSTTRGTFGLGITGFSPSASQPVLPTSAPVALSRGAVRIA